MNVLKPDKKSTIITLLKNGISQREVSRKTSIDRKTIRKYGNGRGPFSRNGDLDSKSPTEGEVATLRGVRPYGPEAGPDCIISQNPPPWPP